MKPLRIVQISDLHLGADDRRHQDNWDITLEWLAEAQPDLVVVTGDVILHDCDSESDLDFARTQLDRIAAPWKVLPGNHDIGDNVMSGGGKLVNETRLQRWRDRFGPDYWIVTMADWTFIGLNAQTLHSNGLAAERQQAEWLQQELSALPADRQIALFIHKPMFMDCPSESASTPDCLDPASRAFIYDAFRGRNLRLIACGHKHQYRSFALDGIYYMWAPSVSTVNHPPEVKMWGLREVGFIDYTFVGTQMRQSLVGRDFLFRHESYVCNRERQAQSDRLARS
jgi:3',5'-cyclic AMP phosphodiesterase CpdA